MKEDLHIVGIGASAGGLDAIQQVFDNIPNDTGMAFVVIQHLSPDFKSLMPELLAKHTTMELFTAEEGMEIKPNCIYLNQRQKNLTVAGNKLHLSDKLPRDHLNLPIDIFFTSLGQEYGTKAIGVVLSGTGSDGSRGIKVISENGGVVIAQDPSSAQFDGMPNAAIATHLVDYIVAPDIMGEVIEKSLWGLDLNISGDIQNNDDFERTYLAILKEVQKQSGIDFSEYKRATILRRLEKRIAITNKTDLREYLALIQKSGREREALKQDFLIGVTAFFRDLKAYSVIKTKVIPNLVLNKPSDSVIRVWVAGCSSGEEVYSLAMLLDEYIHMNQLSLDYKIFATDIDNEALVNAGSGIFPVNIASEVERNYLEHYFVKVGDRIQIIKRIRERVVFSQHNLMTDPPFIRMDMISCRNLLIYLDSSAQQRILTRFQFALEKNGYLFLGASESLGNMGKYFNVEDHRWKIFRKNTEVRLLPNQVNPEDKLATSRYAYGSGFIGRSQAASNQRLPELQFLKFLSKKFAPVGVVTDGAFNVLYVVGDVSKHLSVNAGMFPGNLLDMVSMESARIIRTGVRQLKTGGADVRVRCTLPVQNQEGAFRRQVDILIASITEGADNENNNTYFIGFVDGETFPSDVINLEAKPLDDITSHRLNDLEEELKLNRAELQNATEELETSNEELQSSNEELMASNEELQSTNEELQSVNEELYTVNAELQEKNRELSVLNNDINNLFNSTDIGTLFLDVELNIRKFTPALKIHFSLRDDDIGRNITTFAPGFDTLTRNLLIKECDRALRELVTVEHEITSHEETHYLMRVSPFITADKKIDGLIISFIDIQNLRRSQDELLFLNNINKFMEEEETFEQFLSQTARNVAKLLKISICNLYVVDENRENIRLAATSFNEKTRKEAGKLAYVFTCGHKIPLSTNKALSKVVSQKATLRTTDPEKALSALINDSDHLESVPDVVKKLNYPGMLRIPLKHLQEVLGIIEVPSSEANSNETSTSLERIASQLALTLYKFASEKRAREFQSGFQSIVDATPIPIMITRRKDNTVCFTNHACMAFFNLESFQTAHEIHWIKDPREQKEIAKVLESQGLVVGREVQGLKSDGSEFTALYSCSRMQYLGEECVFHGLLDVTERAQTRLQLERLVEVRTADLHGALKESEDARNKLNSIIRSIVEGIMVVSTEGRIQLLNPYAEALLKVDFNQINGKPFKKAGLPQTIVDAIQAAIDTGANELCSATHQLQKHDGTGTLHIVSTSAPVVAKNGDHKGYVVALRDVSPMWQSERMRNDYIATAAHQLRTPLTTITGFAELVTTETDETLRLQYAQSVIEQAQNLGEIIDELLDISKIESGVFEDVALEPTAIKPFIQQFVATSGNLWSDNTLKVKVDIDDDRYYIDQRKLSHCLRNSLNNAAKYSEPGKPIELRVSKDDKYLTFEIEDKGIGMTEEQLTHAFERFWRADTSDAAVEGYGLGLHIVKNFITAMEGHVAINSKIGEGTVVTLHIPINLVTTAV